MKISVIGSGNAATVLAKLCVQKGHFIQYIVARHLEAAEELSAQVGGKTCLIAEYVPAETDLIIVALSDNSLPDAIAGIDFKEIPVVHTAGAVSMQVLQNIAVNYGVLYPLQSLRKEMEIIPPIPFLVEANNLRTLHFVEYFAASLSDNVKAEREEKRIRLHIAAVIVNNFANYLYTVAEEFCLNEKLDFDLLKPLISETAERIMYRSPGFLQTGPASRKDMATLEKHTLLLSGYPEIHSLYKFMTDAIIKK